jgi:hypothetical protein
MHNRIGSVAGKVWRHLGEKGSSTIAQLTKAVGEPTDLVTMALGWLSRENKVTFSESTKGKSTTMSVSLTADERRVFESNARNGAPVAR